MIATWTKRKNIVKLLLHHGAQVEPEAAHWVQKGMIYNKKVGVEQNIWIGSVSAADDKDRLLSPGSSVKCLVTVQDKFNYFSSEDAELEYEIAQILENKSAGESPTGKIEESETATNADNALGGRTSTTTFNRGTAARRRNRTFRQGLNLDVKTIANMPHSSLTPFIG